MFGILSIPKTESANDAFWQPLQPYQNCYISQPFNQFICIFYVDCHTVIWQNKNRCYQIYHIALYQEYQGKFMLTSTLKTAVVNAVISGAIMASVMMPVALTTVAHAAAASQSQATKNLNSRLSGIRSMTANFSQTTQAGNKKTNFTGMMGVQRQNQFRWETKSPAEQLIVANGNTMWIYDKDLQQATRQSVGSQIGEAPALLLSGDPSQIDRHFNVSQPDANKNYFILTPKSSNANFGSLSLSFNGGRPVMMVLQDSIGQTTTIQFSNIALNKKLPATQFNFTPPNGVDVISQ